jgi:hypothetical protein
VVSSDLKLITSLEEAATLFGEAVKQNYQQPTSLEKSIEIDEGDEDSLSDEGPEDEDDNAVEDTLKSSTENSEVALRFISLIPLTEQGR